MRLLPTLFIVPLLWATALAQESKPRAHVIDVPAIGPGLCLHNAFQSNMVLQRNKPVRIWGWADAGEEVSVVIGDRNQKVHASDDRSWSVEFPGTPASSDPKTITVSDSNTSLVLTNVLVGDVWVLGGQSNMEFEISKVQNGALEIVSANFDQIRILTVPAQTGPEDKVSFPRLDEWSDWSGRHFRKGDWDVCTPDSVRELSAIGYVFARRLHMAAQIPIGVIDTSRGGTTLETWTPDATLRSMGTPEVQSLLAEWNQRIAEWDPEADLARRIKQHERRVQQRKDRGEKIPRNWRTPTELLPGPMADVNRPGSCYRNMIQPITGLSVKGVIFHQGFNNALGAGTAGVNRYAQVFPRMIKCWRAAFQDPALPFGIISLCTAGDRQTRDNYLEMMLDDGIYIREAQYKTFLQFLHAGDDQVGFASSFDKRRSWYHPQVKIPVGERMARWALATQYGFSKQVRWKPPLLESMDARDGKLILHLDSPVAAPDHGREIVGFAIAGKDRRFQPAQAEWLIKGRDRNNRPQHNRRVLVLSSSLVPKPIHFRYAWGRNPLANLYSTDHNDLPFATQRSDRWPMESAPMGVLEGQKIENGVISRGQRNKIKQALRQEDMRRRISEAKALLKEHSGSNR